MIKYTRAPKHTHTQTQSSLVHGSLKTFMHSIIKASHSRPNAFNRKTIDSKKLKVDETAKEEEKTFIGSCMTEHMKCDKLSNLALIDF